MKASVDANVIISFLLNPSSPNPPVHVLRAGMEYRYELCLSEGLIQEVNQSVRNKPYLSTRIALPLLDQLIESLRLSAEIMNDVENTPQRRVRDPKDDYLVAHAAFAHVDYLVTGDKDLLVLGVIEGVTIVTPAEFLALLDLPDP